VTLTIAQRAGLYNFSVELLSRSFPTSTPKPVTSGRDSPTHLAVAGGESMSAMRVVFDEAHEEPRRQDVVGFAFHGALLDVGDLAVQAFFIIRIEREGVDSLAGALPGSQGEASSFSRLQKMPE